ncbi:MAG: class I SAM-dependent methyltransferase [Bacteriovoracaceae bacterium]|nr:class I SAM-dependent methyltransferase [Bacteriovoracaceae bacterium]
MKHKNDYYVDNAQEFFDRTVNLSLSENYTAFLSIVKAPKKILDVGCGSGRDSKHFIDSGCEVVSVEPSKTLAAMAKEHFNIDVKINRIIDLDYNNLFDGIWANACLLHIPKDELLDNLKVLTKALKPDGILYMSLKWGQGIEVKEDGRLISYYDADEFCSIIAKIPTLKVLSWKQKPDERPGCEGQSWLQISCQQTCGTRCVKTCRL